MASVVKVVRSGRRHWSSLGVGVISGLLSAVLALVQFYQNHLAAVAALFATVLITVVYKIKRSPELDSEGEKLALGWLFGSLAGLIVTGLVSFVPQPAEGSGLFSVKETDPPCKRIVSYGMRCDENALYEALTSHNWKVAKLLVAGKVGDPNENIEFYRSVLRRKLYGFYRDAGRLGEFNTSCEKTRFNHVFTASTAIGCAQLNSTGMACSMSKAGLSDPGLEKQIEEAKSSPDDKNYEIFTVPYQCDWEEFSCKSGLEPCWG